MRLPLCLGFTRLTKLGVPLYRGILTPAPRLLSPEPVLLSPAPLLCSPAPVLLRPEPFL